VEYVLCLILDHAQHRTQTRTVEHRKKDCEACMSCVMLCMLWAAHAEGVVTRGSCLTPFHAVIYGAHL
jgi:epoxyqueuosine reductase QueG